FLYSNGAKEVHMRSACPPIMFPCKYLNFSGETGCDDLISRRVIKQLEGPEGENHIEEYADGDTERGKALRQCICKQMGFDSLEFQTLQGIVESCGVSEDCICTYCWTGKE
ncbi:MAG: amidophosphoribosyltransferase, partial [Oscillospiraceae bacterium]|nr:amidophosphoribosyltransferase [Oscillospiraceae bacterium]